MLNSSIVSDSGKYECSVNTLPKISHVVELLVTDPLDVPVRDQSLQAPTVSSYTAKERLITLQDLDTLREEMNLRPVAEIYGPPVQYFSSGSTLGLECKISHVTSAPLSLYWNKDGRTLNAKKRSGVSIESEKISGQSTTRLFLASATSKDSGNYTCNSDIANPASVSVIITKGIDKGIMMSSVF